MSAESVIIIISITLIIVFLIQILSLTESDKCYNEKYPLMKYGWNGTDHQEQYIKCMEDKNLNPQSIAIRILGGRVIQ